MTGGLVATVRAGRSAGFAVDVEIEVRAGTTVALVGPNGAGKSTLVNLIAGLVPLDSGHIELNGKVLADTDAAIAVPPEERRIGIVFQDGLLFSHMTVAQNVEFAMNRAVTGSAQDVMDRFGVGGFARRRVDHLSGGEQQLVALARAVAMDPQLLILDEPLTALDVSVRPKIRRLVSELLDEFAGPAIVITHDPAEAFLLGDSILVMENGRITQRGTPAELASVPVSPYVADLVGINFIEGMATEGSVDVGPVTVVSADTTVSGPVAVLIHPRSVGLFPHPPEGTTRNVWQTTVRHIERLENVVRVVVDGPIPLIAEVTPEGAEAAGLIPGEQTWLAVKATEVTLRRTRDP